MLNHAILASTGVYMFVMTLVIEIYVPGLEGFIIIKSPADVHLKPLRMVSVSHELSLSVRAHFRICEMNQLISFCKSQLLVHHCLNRFNNDLILCDHHSEDHDTTVLSWIKEMSS